MGLLRLFLALSVIAMHTQSSVFSFNGIGGGYAVNLFFVISGFYMAMVLNEKYKNTSPIRFYKSRALRLFPIYYVGVALMLMITFSSIVDFIEHLSAGAKILFLFQNIFIFGQDLSYVFCVKTTALECARPTAMAIDSPAWSLAVELGFYLIAPFVLKSTKKTFVFVLIGGAYLLSLNGIHFPLGQVDFLRSVDISTFNYFFYPSSIVFFGGGALAYHLSKRSGEPHYLAAVGTIILLSFVQTTIPFWHLLFICLSIPVLFSYTKTNRIDRSIGELSYPVYILHYPIMLFIHPLTQAHPEYFKFIGFGSWVAMTACLLGILTHLVIEVRVNKYRDAITSLDTQSLIKQRVGALIPRTLLLSYFIVPVALVFYIYSVQSSVVQKAETAPYHLTDNNWINGIAIKFPGFLVNNTQGNLDYYRVGNFVRFSNGEIRKIVRTEQSADFLNIYISGSPLNGEEVGFPNKIEIAK